MDNAQLAAALTSVSDQLSKATAEIVAAIGTAGQTTPEVDAAVAKLQAKGAAAAAVSGGAYGIGKGGLDARAAAFWAFVGIPLAWGIWITLQNAMRIF